MTMRRVTLVFAGLFLICTAMQAQIDPYKSNARPSHSIPLGLPKNDDQPMPTGTPPKALSYCAYKFLPVEESMNGSWAIVYYNAANGRQMTITHRGDGTVGRALQIPDSSAFYMIDDEKKTIRKFSPKEMGDKFVSGLDELAETKTVRSSQGEKIVSNDGRWCLRKALNATSTDKTGKTEELVTYQYYDMETGILLREDGSNQSFLRGIQLGLFYPELFDLPKGYKMQDMTKSMMGAMEALLKVQNSEGTPEEKQKQLQEMLKSLQK